MHTSSLSPTITPTRFARRTSWTLRLLAAAAFLAAGGAKLAAVPMMVEVFEHIGLGQWLRIFTGVVEVIGALALLLPATVAPARRCCPP